MSYHNPTAMSRKPSLISSSSSSSHGPRRGGKYSVKEKCGYIPDNFNSLEQVFFPFFHLSTCAFSFSFFLFFNFHLLKEKEKNKRKRRMRTQRLARWSNGIKFIQRIFSVKRFALL